MRLRSCKFISVFILLIASCVPARSSSHISSLYAYVLNNRIPNLTCDFENSCSWNWSSDSFTNTSGVKLEETFVDASAVVPRTDADGNKQGRLRNLQYLSAIILGFDTKKIARKRCRMTSN